MNDLHPSQRETSVEALFEEADYWHVNTGETTIHAKRLPGRWRSLKWLANASYLTFFLGPYLRWDERQAMLFDIPGRQFHLFATTILPQDLWMLALLLMLLAILLLATTAIAGRIWCGFLCFQTVWTDLYTWIEERLEGPPQQRYKLDKAPLSLHKVQVKTIKHALWMAIAILTGLTFAAWFTDAYALWGNFFALDLHPAAWTTIATLTAFTYCFAGFMREQVCMWICPYARIQGVMTDATTMLVTYDLNRGEPRGRRHRGEEAAEQRLGDCIDCNQCVAVCPTGVDIRHGQQEGCINCALCIDACDAVMDKVRRPRGLIRFESLDGLEGKGHSSLLAMPRVWILNAILLLSLGGIIYGFSTIDAVELKVLHARQPLFVMQSDGSIQNRYTLKVLNKITRDVTVRISATGPNGLLLVGAEKPITATNGKVTPVTVFVRVPRENLSAESEPIRFRVETVGEEQPFTSERGSIFIGPKS